MSPPAAKPQPASGGSTSAETLIRRAHEVLAANGFPLSPSKVTRLVREYKTKVEPHGVAFADYLSNAIHEIADHRGRRFAGTFLTAEDRSGRPTVHSDHVTGERATWNAFVEDPTGERQRSKRGY